MKNIIKGNLLQSSIYNSLFCLLSLVLLLQVSSCEAVPDVPEPEILGPTELACSIDEPMTLKNNPNEPVDYIVKCKVSISSALNIEAGTVIEFASEAGFEVRDVTEASLVSLGTAAEPVIMRGTATNKGFWLGVKILSPTPVNELVYTVINGAGSSSFNGADVQAGLLVQGKATIRNCTFENIAGNGVFVHSWAQKNAIEGFASNTFRDCDSYPVELGLHNVYALDQNSVFSGNAIEKIFVYQGGDIIGDHQWDNTGIPLLIDNNIYVGYAGDPGSLTITEGTELQFMVAGALRVNSNGYLRVAGSPSSPVIIRGETAAPGTWRGLYVLSNDVRNQIDHAIISHGGGTPHDGSSIRSLIRMGTVGTCCGDAKLNISNSTLSHVDCLYSLYDSDGVKLTEDNVVTENIGSITCD